MDKPGSIISKRTKGVKRQKITVEARSQNLGKNGGGGEHAPILSTSDQNPQQTLVEICSYLRSKYDQKIEDHFIKASDDIAKWVDEVRASRKGEVDPKLLHKVHAMLYVYSHRFQRARKGGYWDRRQHIGPVQRDGAPREPELAMASANNAPKDHFSWTQRYWRIQSELQRRTAMPPPREHPRHTPFQQNNPKNNKINYEQCQERWTYLRTLQFDLLYMTYASLLTHDPTTAKEWDRAPELRMLLRLKEQKLISGFENNWNVISQISQAKKLELMKSLGVDSLMFEGCNRSTTIIGVKPLNDDEASKLREAATRKPFPPTQDSKKHDKMLGKFLNELEQYEILTNDFAGDQAAYDERKRMDSGSKILCRIAKPLIPLGPDHPRDDEIKELLATAVLRENIENHRSRKINHSHNWKFARQIHETQRKSYFSLSRWPSPPRKESSSSSGSGRPGPSGGAIKSPIRDPPRDEQDIYEAQVGNARLAGLGPGPALGRKEIEREQENHDEDDGALADPREHGVVHLPYEVGSGMLVPREVFGLDDTVGEENDAGDVDGAQTQAGTQVPPDLPGIWPQIDMSLREYDAQMAELRRDRGFDHTRDGTITLLGLASSKHLLMYHDRNHCTGQRSPRNGAANVHSSHTTDANGPRRYVIL